MTEKKTSSKDIMLAHSKAKVDYYQRYLERYLSIMSVVKSVDEVNIFDVFCGRGVYDDGGLGSPIRTVGTVKKVISDHSSGLQVNLFFNDAETSYVERVKQYINEHYPEYREYCSIVYWSVQADSLLEKLCKFLPKTGFRTKNFLFIDPYGYKDINKQTFERLMRNENTEILLFLPISFMHRFTRYAFKEDANQGAMRLREFIEDFFPKEHKVRSDEPIDVKEYIDALTEAFSFGGKYYATSYFIERDCRNHFALFFICHNLLGLEKAIEAKWSLDEADGNGFHQPKESLQKDLFDDFFQEENRKEHFEELKTLLLSYLSSGRKANSDIYRFILKHGYLPKHANAVLRHLQDNKMIKVTLFSGKEPRKHSFYINYNDSENRSVPKAFIELNNENNKD